VRIQDVVVGVDSVCYVAVWVVMDLFSAWLINNKTMLDYEPIN
jgi:hypothetical protein